MNWKIDNIMTKNEKEKSFKEYLREIEDPKNNQEVNYVAWDFAGQSEYSTLHPVSILKSVKCLINFFLVLSFSYTCYLSFGG